MSQFGGIVKSVATGAGNLVFYGEGNGLVAADFSNPSSPVIRGRIALPGMVNDIAVAGNYAYIANGSWGLQIVDISTPTAMARVGFYDTPAYSYRIELDGNTAFIADGSSVEIIDVQNKTTPSRIASFSNGRNIYDLELFHVGGRLISALAAGSAGVCVIDFTDPLNSFEVTIIEAGNENRNLSSEGNRLVCASGSNGLDGAIYDFSNPNSPFKVSSFSDQFRTAVSLIKGDRVYRGTGDLRTYQLPNTSNPGILDFSGINSTYDLAISNSGNIVYLANGRDGLIAADVTNGSSPFQRSVSGERFGAGDLQISGNTAYVAFGGSYYESAASGVPMLGVFDVSNASKPVRRGTANWEETVDQIFTFGGRLFATTQQEGLATFNVSNPANPTFISNRFTGGYTYSATQFGNYFALGMEEGSTRAKIKIVDAANISNNSIISDISLSNSSTLWKGLASHGTTVFAVLTNSEMRIYDYSNAASPSLLGSVPFSAFISGMAVSSDGKTLAVSDSGNGLTIFDCSDYANPVLAATYQRNGNGNGTSVTFNGGLLFFGNGGSVNVLNVDDPQKPQLLGFYDTPGEPYSIRVVGDKVYVADGDAGVQVLQLGDLTKPLIEIVSPTQNTNYETGATSLTVSGTASSPNGVASVVWSNSQGGGGTAAGTTNWSIDDILIYAGANQISVTVEDSEGNTATDALTVVGQVPDTNRPVILTTVPTSDDAFTTQDPVITLEGTVDDDRSLQEVRWSNSQGGSGLADLAGKAWSITDLPLNVGANVFRITAVDTAGNEGSDQIAILHRLPDFTAPTVQITFPTAIQTLETSSKFLQISGVADDNYRVASVQWRNHRGGSGSVAGNERWSANDIRLFEGINVITVSAVDFDGNVSEDSLSVDYTPTIYDLDYPDLIVGKDFRLELEWPFENAKYTVRGLPKGLRFDRSTGEIIGRFSRGGTYNLKVWVNSVGGRTGPFIVPLTVDTLPAEVTGTFQATIERGETVNLNLGGEVNLKVNSSGSFSGNLVNGKDLHHFRGLNSVSMNSGQIENPIAEFTINRKNQPPLEVRFEFDGSTEEMNGSISDGLTSTSVSGFKQVWNRRYNRPADYEGNYNVLIDLNENQGLAGNILVPQGIGFERISINSDGKIKRSGKLPDGTPFTDGSFLSSDGYIQLHRLLYRNQGSVLGLGNIDPDPNKDFSLTDSQLQGSLDWNKKGPSSRTDRLYNTGFNDNGETPVKLVSQGRRWIQPTRGNGLLEQFGISSEDNNANLNFQNGGIEVISSTHPNLILTLDNRNRIILPKKGTLENLAWLTTKVDLRTGIFSGSFRVFDEFPQGTGRTLTRNSNFQGLLVPGLRLGAGYFQLPQVPANAEPPKSSPVLSGSVIFQPN